MQNSYWVNDVFHQEIDGVLRRQEPSGDGVRRCWYANGVLEKEWERKSGKVEGVLREWHDNGKIARETPYVNGVVHGRVKQWNREGVLLGEYEMKMGQGVRRQWNENGSPSLEMEQVTSNAIKGRVWDDLGKAWEVFLWNGKPIAKKKFYERVARE